MKQYAFHTNYRIAPPIYANFMNFYHTGGGATREEGGVREEEGGD